MACDDLRAALAAAQGQRAALEQEIADTPAQERAAFIKSVQAQWNKVSTQIATATAALNSCLGVGPPQKVAGAQPQEILTILQKNPAFGGNGTGSNWAGPIAGSTFPTGQGFEWKQVMDTTAEYDGPPVGATGWVYTRDISDGDFWFLHPFGNDWEFSCVLDTQYLPLVSQGNQVENGAQLANDLTALGIPQDPYITNAVQQGLLYVEWDSNLVPLSFQNEVTPGDRVAVFGRWIVDCGHSDFHTEIHPPLLLASASVYNNSAISGGPSQYTRSLFTSRAFLVGQTFFNSTYSSQVYVDGAGDDGHFLQHMLNEVSKAENWDPFNGSLKLEAHPKIKQNPFLGPIGFFIIVRAPQTGLTAANGRLVVSFQFTVRTGCLVTIKEIDDSSVTVVVVMNSAGYTPPALPVRTAQNIGLGQIDSYLGTEFDVLGGLGLLLNIVKDPVGAAVIARGVETDLYAALPDVDFTAAGSPGAVINADASAIPSGQGVLVDDTQPYPVVGWLELGFVPNSPVTIPRDWESLGGLTPGDVSAVSWAPNRLDLFVRGTDSVIYHKYFDVSWEPSMTDWESLGGATPGDVSAVSWAAGRLDLFVRGTDSVIYHKYFEGVWS